jgi:hypothetical protein
MDRPVSPVLTDPTQQMGAIVSGGAQAAPPAAEWRSWLDTARDQGVVSILFDRARALAWDPAFVEDLRAAAAAETAAALAQLAELRSVLDALAAAGIDVLLIKGAHLGLSCYRSPGLRPRADTDLLIDERRRDGAWRALLALGYQPLPHVTGDVAFTQRQFWRIDGAGCRHALDVHWRISNPRAFADRLSWAELCRDRVPILRGGPHAFGPSAPHALLLACIHRTAHHHNSERLIWLVDLRLLAASLSPEGWQEVVDTAAAKGISQVVAAGLRAAQELVNAPVPPIVLHQLNLAPAPEPDMEDFVEGRHSAAAVIRSDWRRLHGWRDRVAFLREHLLPAPAYMMEKYGTRSRAVLPLLYLHRVAAGWWRWTSRQSNLNRGASPLGLSASAKATARPRRSSKSEGGPYTRSRSPLRRLAPIAWLASLSLARTMVGSRRCIGSRWSPIVSDGVFRTLRRPRGRRPGRRWRA